jgi:hypothetical protein
VRGLDIYQFRFGASRFRSFEDHIGSWSGRVDELGPDTLGPGTTTATVAGLWGATAPDISSVMDPSAPAAERERIFTTWTAGLGLAIKDDVTELEISRYVEEARTRALLIESPEALDFTSEITATLIGRKRGEPRPPRPPRPPGFPGRGLGDRFASLARQPLSAAPLRSGRPSVDETILDVEILAGALRLRLHAALANAGELAVAVVAADGSVDLYRGTVRPPWLRGQPPILHAAAVGPLAGHLPPGSDLAAELSTAQPGAVFLVTTDLIELVGRWGGRPLEVDVPVDVALLQSGDARRALVIPLAGGAAPGLATGPYRLTLALNRKRWETTESADDLNTYARSVTISFDT